MVLLMWGLLSSCISEDYSDCTNRYVVELSYYGDGREDVFGSKIDKVRMYIFDSSGECLHQGSLTEEEVSRQRVMLPPLEGGDYRIVFLGNPYSTDVRGLRTRGFLSGLHFGAISYWNGLETSGNDPLYWAAIDQRIEPFSSERQITYSTARFAASHYDISVEVSGAPSVPKIVLTGVSPYTDFNNVAAVDAEAEYVLDAICDNGTEVKAECNILRHLDHENVYLKILAGDGTELASVNFDEFLQENSRYIDCSKQEVLIPFKIEFRSAEVYAGLPDWVVIDTKPDWN